MYGFGNDHSHHDYADARHTHASYELYGVATEDHTHDTLTDNLRDLRYGLEMVRDRVSELEGRMAAVLDAGAE